MKTTLIAYVAAALVAGGLGLNAAEEQKGASTRGEVARTTPGNADIKSQLDKQDQRFVHEAAQGSMMEVKLGEIASQKAAAAEVKEFGQMMVKDHGQASKELGQIVSSKGMALPADLEDKHQSKIDRLSKLSGEEFDKAYVDEMVKAHKKDVSEFEKASKSLKDEDLKNFASKKLPKLQGHLQHAQGLKDKKQ